MSETFQDRIAAYTSRVDQHLDVALPVAGRRPERLHEAMRYAVLNGGKRVRPLLVYAAGECLGIDAKLLDAPAVAIELIHAFSLVHDDLPAMDDDDLRRGKPTVHRQYDEATAILAADALQPLAFSVLANMTDASESQRIELLRLVTLACGSIGMTGGQSIDLDAEGKSLTVAELEHMYSLKTGALIHASIVAPAYLSTQLDDASFSALDEFGRTVGVLFQLKDDILDVEGETSVIGKPAGSDESLNKATYPALFGLPESKRRCDELLTKALQLLQHFADDATALSWLARYIVAEVVNPVSDSARSVLHVDMDAFYASVEQRDNPAFRGKPLVVGGGENRGVVAAASYEAREFGIRSAMPMAEAMRRCRHLLRVTPRMSHYKKASTEIFTIFREFTPLVEGLSLDEAFLDVTASVKLFGTPERIAANIKQRISDVTKLTASVGVAENKLVAKIASDLDKPDGLSVVMPSHYRAKLDPLPVRVIPGIGQQTLKKLERISVATVRDLRLAADCDLEPIFGRFTQKTRDRAAGIDTRPVISSREEKSISAEETYDTDLHRPADMDRELLRLAERAATRMRKASLAAATVQIKIRRHDFKTYTRQQSANPPCNGTDQIHSIAKSLLQSWLAENPGARIRLLGVGGSQLAAFQQADLFAGEASQSHNAIDETVDEIRQKFGSLAVGRAKTLDR